MRTLAPLRSVPDPPRAEPVDYALLASFLSALSYPARLELLDVLRQPRGLSEIHLTPHRIGPDGRTAATASRPTILGHLNRLVDADLIRAERVQQGGRTVPVYTVNPQKLYVLTEELRRITTQHAGRGPAGDETGTMSTAAAPRPRRGPRLVLVHGAYEGRSYPLDVDSAEDGVWTLGRQRGLPISLDYDPFVSVRNAVVARRGDAFTIADLPDSKNGTSVNWMRLPKGGTHTLEPADIIGVGRSLLAFAPA